MIGSGAPLAAVLESISREGIVAAPRAIVTDQVLGDLVLWDPLEDLPRTAGGVLLLVGSSVQYSQFGSLLGRAAEAGYVAAIIKRRGEDLGEIVDAALRVGLVLLVARDDLSWSVVESVLAGAMAACTAGAGAAGVEPTDDLFSMANAIASMAGAAVTIEDTGRRVLAYSSIAGHAIDSVRRDSILGRQVRPVPDYDAEYLAVARARDHVRFGPEAETELARVVVPVRIGGRLLGSVWAVDDGIAGRANRAAAALEKCAPAVALALMSAMSREDGARRRRSELLAAQLGALGTDQSGSLTSQLPLAILGFGPLTHSGALDEQRLIQIIRVNIERLSLDAACAKVDNAIFALLPSEAAPTPGILRRIAKEVSTSARSSGAVAGALRCAFAARITDTGQVTNARRDISTALQAIAGSRHTLVDVDEQRHLVVLEEVRRSGAADTRHLVPAVRAVLDYDQRHRTSYAATLLAHFDRSGEARAVAQQLGVHENTYRYRLARIIDRFEIDLNNPQLRQVIWLQLRLLNDEQRNSGQSQE